MTRRIKLTKSECFDANAQRTQTIEYEYDALGRLVRKTVTDRAGTVTVIEFVWSGTTLLEEYENGVLVRTYVYSLDRTPARLTVDQGGRNDYWYVHNGRGVAAGLVRATNLNAFAERYGYELTGYSFMKEIDGLKVELPERLGTASSLWNSVLAGDAFGTLSRDWANGTISGAGGRRFDPLIAAALNTSATISGGVHNTLKMTVGKQFESFLGSLGLGGRSNGFISRGGAGGEGFYDKVQGTTSKGSGPSKVSTGGFGLGYSRMARDFSLYAAESRWITDAAKIVVDFVKARKDDLTGVGGAYGGDVRPGKSGPLDPPGKDPGEPAGSPSPAEKQVVEAKEANKPTNKPSAEADKKATKAVDEANQKADEKAKPKPESSKPLPADAPVKDPKLTPKDGAKYVDPDQEIQNMIVVTPAQIEMRLYGRKRPVNPNGGGGGWEIDTSSPPPNHGLPRPDTRTLRRRDVRSSHAHTG